MEFLTEKGVDFDQIIKLRRDIHKYPELAFEEVETQRKIKETLISFGIEEENIKHCAKTGLVVDIKGTADESSEGECNVVAYRADIDALPMEEENDFEYKSVTNAAHMCGHDGHIATLVASAQFWAKNRHKMPKNKCIRLLILHKVETVVLCIYS